MSRSFIAPAVLAALLPASAVAQACGDLWSLSEAAVSFCIGQKADAAPDEHEAALRLMSRGDWSWGRFEDGEGCTLRIELEGEIDGTSYRIERQCTVDDPDALIACTNSALHAAEEALCHLRHIRG